MQLYYYCSSKFDTSADLGVEFEKTIAQFLEDNQLVRLKSSTLALFAGTGREVLWRMKRAQLMKKKVVYFVSPREELYSDIDYIFAKRQELRCARQADLIIVTTFQEKCLLVDGGYPPVALIKGIINPAWYQVSQGDQLIFNKAIATQKGKLVVSCGSVNGINSGLADFVALALLFPQLHFVYLNSLESEQSVKTLRLETPDNFTYLPYGPGPLVRGAFACASLILFMDHLAIRPLKIYQALASNKPTLVRDIGRSDENLISGYNIYKCVNVNDYARLIAGLIDTPINRLKLIKGYDSASGKAVFQQIMEDL